jgi:Rieske Fe-S protein
MEPQLTGALRADEELTRRDFAARLGMTAVGLCYGAAIGYPVYRYLAAPAKMAEALAAVSEVAVPLDKLPAPGTAVMVAFGSRPTLIIRHEDGTLVAFDAICTHLGCTVQFQPERDRIFCACHEGVYDMRSGANVAGPPPKPLRQYNLEETDAELILRRA